MKKIIAAVCTLALALALPLSSAFAAQSSSESKTVTTTGANNTSLTVIGTAEQLKGPETVESQKCDLIVEPCAKSASNTPSNLSVLASYEIYYADREHTEITGGGSIVVDLGCQYANYHYTFYIEHTDGTTETQTGITDASGNASFNVSKLSWYTFVIGAKADVNTDTSSTSPKTGIDYTVTGGIAIVALAGAGVAFAARRKLAK